MKTAMREIIERAGSGIEIHSKEVLNPNNSAIEKNRHTYLLNVCRMFESLAKELLETEKQQIIDAYKAFDHDMTAEEYYTSTFTTNKETLK